MLTLLDRKLGFGRLARAVTIGLVLLGAAFLAACGDDGDTQAEVVDEPQPTVAEATTTPAPPPIQVVATANFVADWARVVGGERVEVFGLLPAGGDPHSYQPGARDVARVADADLVLTVGLGLETEWLDDLIHSASADESRIVVLGDYVDPIEFMDMHDDHEDDHMDHEDDHADHEDDHADHDDHEDDHADHEDDHMDHDDHEDDHADHEDEHADHEDDHADHEDEHADHEDDHADHDDHEDDHMDHEDDHADHDDHEDEHMDHDDHADEEDDHHHHGPHDPHFWFDPIRVKIAVNEIAERLAAIDPANADLYLQNAADYGQELDELHAWTQEQVSMVPPERRFLVTSHDSLSYFANLYGFEVVGLVIPSLSTDVEPSAEHIAGLVDVIREYNVPAVFGETTVGDKLAQAVARETGATVVQLYSGSLGAEGSGADTYLGMARSNVENIVGALK